MKKYNDALRCGLRRMTVRFLNLIILVICSTSGLLSQAQVQITTVSLPNGAEGLPYSPLKLTATPSTITFNWYPIGALPDGLSLSGDGTLSGTPTAAGQYNINIGITASANPTLMTSKAFTIAIQPRLRITGDSTLPLAVVGAFYNQSLQVAGPSPVVWSVISNVPPPGLVLYTTGSLAGVPTASGAFDFTLQVTGGDPVQTATQSFHVVVNGPLTITTAANLPSATVSSAYSAQMAATGGVPPYNWAILGAGLPPGLSLSASGALTGTPTSPGNFIFTVQVSDSFNPTQQTTRNFGIVVSTIVTVTTTSLPDAIQSQAYSQQLQAIGIAPFVWVVISGALPAGLTLNTSGLIQGTPVAPDSKTFTVTVTDSRGAVGTQTFTLIVDPPIPSITAPTLPAVLNPTQMVDISLSLAAPYPGPLSGQIVLSFTSKAEVPTDDPMIQFSSGSRTVSFSVPPNTTGFVFPFPIKLLTGTVAGTVRLVANIDNGPSNVAVALAEIPLTAPQVTSVAAVRTLAGLNVQITGYSTARRVTTVEFNFGVKNGNKTQQVPLSRNVDSDFSGWYNNSASVPFGGSFSFVQSFTIQGDISAIQNVSVGLANAQGSSSSQAVPLQ
jgi:hypothetical protein